MIRLIVLLTVVLEASSGSVEQFDEVAWMDNSGRDKYFEYQELSAPKQESTVNYSTNIDSSQFEKTKSKPVRRHVRDKSSKVIDFFLNTITTTIKKLVNPADSNNHVENETDKGLDVALINPSQQQQVNFGNNQDLQFIYLGTKWCGSGDIAKNRRDVGYFYMTDSCCREHDHCPYAIEAQKTNFGLRNTGKFTRSHCDCDEEFYRCLKSVNTLVSHQIGLLYFSVLGPQCFKEDYPMTCKEKSRGRCISYSIDETQPKRFQWVDNKLF